MAKHTGVRATKSGRIEIRWQIGKTRHTETLSLNYNPTNCAKASRIRDEKIAHSQNADHLRGDNPPFIDVAQDYLNHLRKAGYSKKHTNNVKNDINRRWGLYLGEMGIKDIKVRHCRDADQEIEWSSAKRQQNCRSVLRQIFDFAIEDELVDENPAQKLKAVSHQRAKIDPFTEKERAAILQILGQRESSEACNYFTFAFDTGMRTAELLALDWSDIRAGKAHLSQTLVDGEITKMKTKKERTVLLSPLAMSVLKVDIRPTSGRIFALAHEAYCEAWNTALEAAGVRYRRPYTTRHTRASLGLMAGQTPAWIAKQLGHDLRTFFERYATWMDGDKDEIEMAKWVEKTEVGAERGQEKGEVNEIK